MRLPRGFSDEVRQQADIVKIIGDYVSLKKRGANHIGLCPFHQEKTPSFNVHSAKGIFKCFGCSEGGDVIHFVMRMENCDFPEALRMIAQKSGIPIPAAPADREPGQRQAADLFAINEWACGFFERALASSDGAAARAYLSERAIRPEAATRLRLGYAPDAWEAMTGYLRKKGATPEQLAASGLVVAREEGSGVYDRFRDRLMFPILESGGRVVAFGGRAFRPAASGRESPKYLNSPETPIYTKGRHLYGLHFAKEAIRRDRFVILVEGYLDFLLPFQEGITNIVASLGTALTDQQASLLKRFAERVVVNFDSDPAGRSATLRSVEVLMRAGLPVRVLALPEGEDPDSFVRKRGGTEYASCAAGAKDYIDFVVDQAVEGRDLSHPTTRVAAFRTALPFLSIVPDAIERTAFNDHVAARLNLDPQLVHQEVRREAHSQRAAAGPEAVTGARPAPPAAILHWSRSEKRLMEILLADSGIAGRVAACLGAGEFNGAPCFDLVSRVTQSLLDGGDLEYTDLIARIEPLPEERDLLERAILAAAPASSTSLEQEAEACIAGIRRQRMEAEMQSLQAAMEEAERAADLDRYGQLYARKSDLRKLLAQNGLAAGGVS